MELNIRFLYYEDCPSHEEALARLRRVLDEESIDTEVEVVRVETEEQAQRLRFMGSPTIVVDGEDIDPHPDPHYALVCRAYQLEDGRISPLPSLTMMRRALRAAAKKQS